MLDPKHLKPYPITPADLYWEKKDIPKSVTFDDIFYSRQSPLEEVDYVFIQPNRLPDKFSKPAHQNVTIGEFGFGTGLNFLATWALWRKQRKHDGTLHFISFEKHPIPLPDLKKIFEERNLHDDLAQQLVDQYPILEWGSHTLEFTKDNVRLTLIFADVAEGLQLLKPQYPGVIDSWFLDGFAPAKNNSMWTDQVFELLAQHSHANTTLSTFTAAGFVRRGLQRVGFDMKKQAGFGGKREMLYGAMHAPTIPSTAAPWLCLSRSPFIEKARPKKVAIIGGGLAGCATAYQISHSGNHQITLIDAKEVASGASGNPLGMLSPPISGDPSNYQQLYTKGFKASRNFILSDIPELIYKRGCTEIALTSKTQERLERFISAPFNSFDCATDETSLTIHDAFSIYPQSLCHWWLKNANSVRVLENHPITDLKKLADDWLVITPSWQEAFDIIIFCNSYNAADHFSWLKRCTAPVRGQLSVTNQPLTKNINFGHYALPYNGGSLVGASFSRENLSLEVSEQEYWDYMTAYQRVLSATEGSAIEPSTLDEALQHRVSFRCSTLDRMPIVGPVPDIDYFATQYQALHKGYPRSKYYNAQYQDGLYLNIGYGSRGLSLAVLCASYLAELITGKGVSLESHLVNAMHPARFVLAQ
ncbi:MAG: bifunctional tRNA (5-methylaminomethyl-2-thiouridine)(34)-methyltransferase MnmD/FAD-dependent 5-carboxymethylaminomethyl-2-thiouridine(34) oxidoreductase MnmC [Kangiellaceae bacterium]|nr:bifunctional tRNA (5-methylaminomethyl-2-thiouridine)(34)-methyltransferase MnmD/FAD-dependent 5-carboxymethylaminomethyl-2-thiouridine(34) oxidoreductase MnmC [Kangiellaceae bacterium]